MANPMPCVKQWFKHLNEKGVKLVAQMVPNEDKSDFMKLLREEN